MFISFKMAYQALIYYTLYIIQACTVYRVYLESNFRIVIMIIHMAISICIMLISISIQLTE